MKGVFVGLLDSLKRNTKPAPTSPYEPKASQPADPGYQNFEEINETAQVIERDVAVSTSPYEEPAMPAGQGSVAVEEIDEEFDEGPSYVPFREKGPVSHIIGQTKILAIINQKGGVGKSTTAVNLAAALGAAGKEVLLVDLDPQGNATSGYGIDKRDIGQCVYNVLLGETPVEDVILANVGKGVDVLPSTISLAGAEVELVNEMARENRLKNALGSLRGRYDYILIDTPPIMPVTDAAVLSGKVDGLVMLVSSGEVTPAAAKEAKQRLLQAGAHILGVILNKVELAHTHGYGYYYYYGSDSTSGGDIRR